MHNEPEVAIVTGGAGGIGEAAARAIARRGAHVAVADLRPAAAEEAAARLQAEALNVVPVTVDVSSEASVRAGFDQIEKAVGAVEIIVNNAGVTTSKPALQQSEADWDLVLDTNLKGAWLVAQEGSRRMVAAKRGGSIVNVASILGERVAGGVAPYAISKAGLVQATKALALELARYDIRVNAILPGYVVTDLNRDFLQSEAGEKLRMRIPTRRFGEMQHLDGPLLLLASQAGSHMTGAVLAVDGGHLVSSL